MNTFHTWREVRKLCHFHIIKNNPIIHFHFKTQLSRRKNNLNGHTIGVKTTFYVFFFSADTHFVSVHLMQITLLTIMLGRSRITYTIILLMIELAGNELFSKTHLPVTISSLRIFRPCPYLVSRIS